MSCYGRLPTWLLQSWLAENDVSMMFQSFRSATTKKSSCLVNVKDSNLNTDCVFFPWWESLFGTNTISFGIRDWCSPNHFKQFISPRWPLGTWTSAPETLLFVGTTLILHLCDKRTYCQVGAAGRGKGAWCIPVRPKLCGVVLNEVLTVFLEWKDLTLHWFLWRCLQPSIFRQSLLRFLKRRMCPKRKKQFNAIQVKVIF